MESNEYLRVGVFGNGIYVRVQLGRALRSVVSLNRFFAIYIEITEGIDSD